MHYLKSILFSIMLLGAGIPLIAQSNTLPLLTIKTLEGRDVQTDQLHNDGKPFVISFWATWCRPCLKELNAIYEMYDQWTDEGFKLIAVSTDDARTRANVLPMVRGRGWEYEFYLDENGEFRRAMGVNMVPHTFILNGQGEIVYQHTSFSDGMEYDMLEKLQALSKE